MIDQPNDWSARRFHELVRNASLLGIEVHRDGRLLDMGVNCPGTRAAGIALAEICMGGLGEVSLHHERGNATTIVVSTDTPALACMGCQYGGWPVHVGKFFAIGSGPGRMRRGQEKVLEQYGFLSDAREIVCVLETATLPDDHVVKTMASECRLAEENLLLCVAPSASLAGTIQIVARVLEATMHKLHELDFDLNRVTSGSGSAPLPRIGNNDLEAIGWTNDAIIYGGTVTLSVELEDDQIKALGPRIPGNSSPAFGRRFAELFEECGRDFYKLDPMLFSSAQVSLISNRSGHQFTFGEPCPHLLASSSD